MSSFNAKASRSKRPLPIWIDAFQRDTQHLEADEIGSYFLILMAMWSHESCDFPDDDRRLARVCRVSTRLWKSRIGPIMRRFFVSKGGVLISNRLREEATYVERQVQLQSNRKNGEKYDKSMKDNNQGSTVDTSVDEPPIDPRYYPSQQPNIDNDDDSAQVRGNPPRKSPTFRERMLTAIGVDPVTGLTGHGGAILGTRHDMELAVRWKSDLGLTEETIVAVIAETMAKKPDGQPPNSFKYFNRAMQREAARRDEPPLTPEQSNVQVLPPKSGGYRQSRSSAADDAFVRRIHAAARARSPS